MLLASESPSESSSESSPELSEEDTQGLLFECGTSSACAGWSLADSRFLKNGQSPTLALRSSCFSQWKSDSLERLFCSVDSRDWAWVWDRDRLDHNPFAKCSATSLSTLLLSSSSCSGPRAVRAGSERSPSRRPSGQPTLCAITSLQSATADVLSGHETGLQEILAVRVSALFSMSPFSRWVCFWGSISPTLASSHARPQSAKLSSVWVHMSPISKMSCSQNVEGRSSLPGSGHGRGNMGQTPTDGKSRDMDGIWGPQFSKQKGSSRLLPWNSVLWEGKSICSLPLKGAELCGTGDLTRPPSSAESRARQRPRRFTSCGFFPPENFGIRKSKHADSKVWNPKNSALLWMAWMFSLVKGSLDV